MTTTSAAATPAGEPTTAYLFCHFTGTEQRETDEQLYFAVSRDGQHWHDLRPEGSPILTSNLGERGVRDPYLVRAADGSRTWIIATDLSIYHRGGSWKTARANENGSTSLIVWESEDLAHWSEPWLLDVASRIPGAGMAWAPEAIWDAERGVYMVFWATRSDEDNELGNSTNMYYATTTDFRTVSEPVKWVDRAVQAIDATMLRVGDWYYRASAGNSYIHIERSKDPYAVSTVPSFDDEPHAGDPNADEHQWQFVTNLDRIFGDDFNRLCGGNPESHRLEGPELFRFNDADADGMPFGLMGDRYNDHNGYIAFRTADLSSTDAHDWAAADIDFGAVKKRHGTILPITEREYRTLLDTYDAH